MEKMRILGWVAWWGGGESEDPLAKQQNHGTNITKSHKKQ
jgi:hypothetical protein